MQRDPPGVQRHGPLQSRLDLDVDGRQIETARDYQNRIARLSVTDLLRVATHYLGSDPLVVRLATGFGDGFCVEGGVCVCKRGWRGEACDQVKYSL